MKWSLTEFINSLQNKNAMSGVERYFFIHIQKTAGTSFRQMLWEKFSQAEIYPNHDDLENQKRLYPYLTPQVYDFLKLNTESLEKIRLLCGHYPFIAGKKLPVRPKYLVLFRHPLKRTVSHLKHGKRYLPQLKKKTLAEIFDLKQEREFFLQNAQTKAFSYHTFEEACRTENCIKVDKDRLELAKENVLKCDFVGLTEAFAESVKLCEKIFGWKFERILFENMANEEVEVEPVLKERIYNEIQFDLELYNFACKVYEQLKARYINDE